MPSPGDGRPALDGVRVIDLSHLGAGPLCTLLLADMGAEVIKIEPPGRGEASRTVGNVFVRGVSAIFLGLNRNKKSVAVDLKQAAGQEIIRRLARVSDVVVENLRPGSLVKLGLGYDALQPLNPRLVYCSISGFGTRGPYREKTAMDVMVQAMGGIMAMTGEEGGPPVRAGVNTADYMGGMAANQGILLALLARERTGLGQKVEVSLLGAQSLLLHARADEFFATGRELPRSGSGIPNLAPCEAFLTGDGTFLAVGAFTEKFWDNLCRVLGRDDLREDPRFHANPLRVEHRKALHAILEGIFTQKPRAEWIRRLDAADVPNAPVYGLADLFSDPHVEAEELVLTLDHPTAGRIRNLANPIRLSRTPSRVASPPPALGQHTEEVLGGVLGLSETDLARLREQKVIG